MKNKRRREEKEYTHQSLRDEREYGFFWYSWLWQLLRPLLIGVCVLVLVSGIVMGAWNYVDRRYLQPVDAQDATDVLFVVESGNSLTRVANNLEAQGLVRNRSVFKYYADFMGFGQKIQAGEYTLNRAMTMREIAQQLSEGDGKPITRKITVIPGWTIEDIAARLAANGVIQSAEEFLSLCKTGAQYSQYYYIADVLTTANAAQRKYALEGYLMPDTYEVYTNATADDIVKKLLSQTEAVYTTAFHERTEELSLTMDQVITLASLIEKEAKNSDFARVSAVFHNRLKQNMTLGSDVTIKYVTGSKKMSLGSGDLAVDSLYNTYTHKGLPLGPVCSPSAAAIQAALYPDEVYTAENYLYFCSKDPDTGALHFSKTLEEHNQAVSIYAPLWRAYDEKQGLE